MLEGGDVRVLGKGAVMVGMGERTTGQAVETLAARLFAMVDREGGIQGGGGRPVRRTDGRAGRDRSA